MSIVANTQPTGGRDLSSQQQSPNEPSQPGDRSLSTISPPTGEGQEPERPRSSRGSTVQSDADYLPPIDFHIDHPVSGTLAQAQHSPHTASLVSGDILAQSPSILPPQQQDPRAARFFSPEDSAYSLRSNSSSPGLTPSSTPDSESAGLNTRQLGMLQECLWNMQSVLGLHFDADHISEGLEVVSSEDGEELELCEQGKARGIYIVESGELEITTGEGEGEIKDLLRPGDFCGELSALFRVPQFIKATSHNRYG